VWPEPTSSAAGFRMMQLIDTFLMALIRLHLPQRRKSPYSAPLQSLGMHEQAIVLNSNSFDDFITQLQPDIVVFDRFMVEEQYGWRVAQHCLMHSAYSTRKICIFYARRDRHPSKIKVISPFKSYLQIPLNGKLPRYSAVTSP
jgi:hypothetical protein